MSHATPAAAMRRVVDPVKDFLQTEAAGGCSCWRPRWSPSAGPTPLRRRLRGTVEHGAARGRRPLRLTQTSALGQRRPDGAVLLRRRPGDQARAGRRRAARPRRGRPAGLAALGGMVVPAVIYLAFNAGGAGGDGWGIPMATDIAFAVGVLACSAPGSRTALKVFLLDPGHRRRHRRDHRDRASSTPSELAVALAGRRRRRAGRWSSSCDGWGSARSALYVVARRPGCGWPPRVRGPRHHRRRRPRAGHPGPTGRAAAPVLEQLRAPAAPAGRASWSSRCSRWPTPACRSAATRWRRRPAARSPGAWLWGSSSASSWACRRSHGRACGSASGELPEG